jgi:hypothetical protein
MKNTSVPPPGLQIIDDMITLSLSVVVDSARWILQDLEMSQVSIISGTGAASSTAVVLTQCNCR